MQNVKDYQLEEDHKGTVYLRLDKLSPVLQTNQSENTETEATGDEAEKSEPILETQATALSQTKTPPLPSICQEAIPTVFISHIARMP
jgi:hypothetical protein